MRSEQDQAEMYGLTLEQLKDARKAATRQHPAAAANTLLALYLKWPEPAWKRVIAAAINLRKMAT